MATTSKSPKLPSALKNCTNATDTDDKGNIYYQDPITFDPIDPTKSFKLPVGNTVQCYNIDTIYDYIIQKGNTKDINTRETIPTKTILAIILRYFEVHNSTLNQIERWLDEPSIQRKLNAVNVLNYVLNYVNLYRMYHDKQHAETPVVLQDVNQVCLYNPKIYKNRHVYEWIYMSKRSQDIIGLQIPTLKSIQQFTQPTDENRLRFISRLNHLNISIPREKAIKDHLDAYYKIPVEGLVVAYNYSYSKHFKEDPYISIIVYNTNYNPYGYGYMPAFKYEIHDGYSLDVSHAEIRFLGHIGNLQPLNEEYAVFKNNKDCADGILNALSYSFNRLNAEDAAIVLKKIRENPNVKDHLKLLDSPKQPSNSRPSSSGGRRSKFEKLTVKELQGLCKDRAIAYSGLRKADLILKLQRKK